MNIKSIKNELQNILSGTSGYSYDAVIQATTNYLRTSQKASPMAERKHENQGEETAKFVAFLQEMIFYKWMNKRYKIIKKLEATENIHLTYPTYIAFYNHFYLKK